MSDLKKAFEELDKTPLLLGECATAEEEEPGIVVLRTASGHPAIIMSVEDFKAALKWEKKP